jgi:hypothetical protein
MSNEPTMLGPFLGHVTTSSIKIWLHVEGQTPVVYVTVHARALDGRRVADAELHLLAGSLYTACVEIGGLQPDTRYYYRLWTNPAFSLPLPLDGLEEKELRFRTLPTGDEQLDFVVMSCHNPTVAAADGFDGHAVWADLPQILGAESNTNVRFALLVGDQVYADDWKERILAAKTDEERIALYLSVYRRFWSHIHYRRVMCSLPAVMMWDDHDIMDGWGSEASSFDGETSSFKPEWQQLFEAAFKSFAIMQASRNPGTLALNPREGLDFCFRIGRWGFVFLDLRTNRNWRLHRLLTDEQAYRIRGWVEQNKRDLQTLFVISPVVFSHGSPGLEKATVAIWPWVMRLVEWLGKGKKSGQGFQTKFDKQLGDIRDDIRDSWGCDENAGQTDELLDFLFGAQNDTEHSIGVVILSGDIHTSGYASIYSNAPEHVGRSSIPHITSSSVSYTPFNWLLEAIYRHTSKTVALGKKGRYSSQISHHFTSRSVAVLSLRPSRQEGDYHLKVKYYLEGYPEPQILLFDLDKAAHRENVSWVAQQNLFAKEYAPSANVEIEKLLVERAKGNTEAVNWRESIVDLMKVLGVDSSLGARKKLAQEWGYTGTLNGSAEMNIWLHQQMIHRIRQAGGNVPADI